MSGAIKINGTSSGSTTITAPASGGDESIELSTALAAKLDATSQKILQVVRASDSTQRTTTSTSYVDAGISVAITPTNASNYILLIWGSYPSASATGTARQYMQITKSDNTAVNGAEGVLIGLGVATGNFQYASIFGWTTAGTTSSMTFKGRFRLAESGSTARLFNDVNTGALYAIEVGA